MIRSILNWLRSQEEVEKPEPPPAAVSSLSHEARQLRVMCALLQRLNATPGGDIVALRGSLPLYGGAGDTARLPNDIDVVLLGKHRRAHAATLIRRATRGPFAYGLRFGAAEQQQLWPYADVPGTRFLIPWRDATDRGQIQVDVAEGEHLPLAPEPTVLRFPAIQQELSVLCCAKELDLSWKICWLFSDAAWYLKDLYDTLLLLRSGQLDAARFQAAMLGTFAHHDIDLVRLYELLDGSLVHREHDEEWKALQRSHGLEPIDVEQTFFEISNRLADLLEGAGLPQAAELPFLRQVLRSPDDDASRLVYADWLEDRGDPRAELLRLDTELRPTFSTATPEQIKRHADLVAAVSKHHFGWALRLVRVYSAT